MFLNCFHNIFRLQVIVAGGTMQPTTEFTAQLFRDSIDRVEQHFFGHVVSSDAVLPIGVSKGPRNSRFLFNFAHRGNQEMVSGRYPVK